MKLGPVDRTWGLKLGKDTNATFPSRSLPCRGEAEVVPVPWPAGGGGGGGGGVHSSLPNLALIPPARPALCRPVFRRPAGGAAPPRTRQSGASVRRSRSELGRAVTTPTPWPSDLNAGTSRLQPSHGLAPLVTSNTHTQSWWGPRRSPERPRPRGGRAAVSAAPRPCPARPRGLRRCR